jgi:hypothetical protein
MPIRVPPSARKQALALERTTYLIEYFASNPCVDCGETDPVVLEFDHLAHKLFDIGQSLPWRNWESIVDEIAKCDVVCANATVVAPRSDGAPFARC